MDYEKIMEQARKTNAQRDQSERKSGFQAESDAHPFMRIRTAMMAIQAGISIDDWSCVAEAQAILESAMRDISAATGQQW